jgi:dipeptide/tripeptide permease
LNAGILAAGLVVYILVARTYEEKPVMNLDKVRHQQQQHQWWWWWMVAALHLCCLT